MPGPTLVANRLGFTTPGCSFSQELTRLETLKYLKTTFGSFQNGIHSIMLDARSGRDPTYTEHGQFRITQSNLRTISGACKGAASQMMTDVQWKWLEVKLAIT